MNAVSAPEHRESERDHSAASVAVAAPQHGGDISPADVHILLVDDESLSRLLVGNLLRKCNYRVTVAESGLEALRVLHGADPGTFQLILTDVMMPEVDGLELLRFVRTSPLLANLPVVMMSASDQKETVYQCIRGGAEEYLVKPVTKKEVQNIWMHVIKRLNAMTLQPERRASDQEAADGKHSPIDMATVEELYGVLPAGGGDMAAHRAELAAGSAAPPLPPLQLTAVPHPLPASQDPAAVALRIASGALASTSAAGAQQWQQSGPGGAGGAGGMGGGGARHAAPGGGVGGGASADAPTRGVKAGQVNLHRWLSRPQRSVQPRESFWIFCEVMLLLEQGRLPGRPPPQRLRPSRMLLHSTGRVTFVPPVPPGPTARPAAAPGGPVAASPALAGAAAVAAAAAVAVVAAAGTVPAPVSAASVTEEELLFRSPEEVAGWDVGPAADVFALGVLFFDLFYVPHDGARQQVLKAVRQRELPAQFTRDRPREAAFALTLLHPDPTRRPTLGDLLASDTFRQTADALRQRHSAHEPLHAPDPHQGQVCALEDAALVDFLRMMQQKRTAEILKVRRDMGMLDADIYKVQHHLSQPHPLLPGHAEDAQQQHATKRRRVSPSDTPLLLGAGLTAGDEGAPPAPAAAGSSAATDGRGTPDICRLPSAAGAQQQQQHQLQHPQHTHQQQQLVEANGAASGSGAVVVTGGNHLVSHHHLHPSHQQLSHPLSHQQHPTSHHHHTLPVPEVSEAAQRKWRHASGVRGRLQDVFFKRREAELGPYPAAADAPTDAPPPAGASHLPPLEAPLSALPQLSATTSAALAAVGAPHVPQTVMQLQPHPLTSAAAAVAATANGTIVLRDPHGAVALRDPHGGATSPPGALAGSVLPDYLSRFSEDLPHYTRWQRLRIAASLRCGEAPSSLVSSVAFDRDDEFFATAGVSKRIQVFEYSGIVSAPHLGRHYPVLELSSRSRLSSICWSAYIKAHLASSDFEGVVQLWDTHSGVELMTFEEHTKRAWCVDFSQQDPTRLVSGSDDGTVKVWSINQERSALTIDSKYNVCSVQFSPESSHLVAFGSANYRIYLYDLRHSASPLAVVPGHTKAVSYVRHLSGSQLVSASIDNTLKLWDIRCLLGHEGAPALGGGHAGGANRTALAGPACVVEPEMTFAGHCNERNFVGLSVTPSGYIACGSEDNSVCCYYKAMPMPMLSCSFEGHSGDGHRPPGSGGGAATAGGGGGGGGGTERDAHGGDKFVSSVCWSHRGDVLLAANSAGAIKIMAPA